MDDMVAMQVKRVVLVGCGGALPILDFMDAEEDAVFYIIDRCVHVVCVCVCL